MPQAQKTDKPKAIMPEENQHVILAIKGEKNLCFGFYERKYFYILLHNAEAGTITSVKLKPGTQVTSWQPMAFNPALGVHPL